MTIEEHVEQFRLKHGPACRLYAQTASIEFDGELYALLRKVVEECCARECTYCQQGWRLGTGENCELHVEPKSNVLYKCKSRHIRRHFAWLKEGE